MLTFTRLKHVHMNIYFYFLPKQTYGATTRSSASFSTELVVDAVYQTCIDWLNRRPTNANRFMTGSIGRPSKYKRRFQNATKFPLSGYRKLKFVIAGKEIRYRAFSKHMLYIVQL